MGFPKDIINIVISMKSKDEKKRLNCNYYDKYVIYNECFYYKSKNKMGIYFINYRNIRCEIFRKEILCFITNTLTKYKVPKNY